MILSVFTSCDYIIYRILWCVQVKANMPQLTLAKELMVHLVADEESYGESGYYLVTFEAAVHHISDLAQSYTTYLASQRSTGAAAPLDIASAR